MKTRRTLLTTAVLSAVLSLAGDIVYAQNIPGAPGACLPGIGAEFHGTHRAAYRLLLNALSPNVGTLQTHLDQVADQATYQSLLTTSRTIANSIPDGRMVVTLPDGTVVLDTFRPDDPTTGQRLSYVALRLGNFLDSSGTARLSTEP